MDYRILDFSHAYVVILVHAHTHGGWAHWQRVSTTFMTRKNSHKFFLCSWRDSNLGPLDLESDALYQLGHPITPCVQQKVYMHINMFTSTHPCCMSCYQGIMHACMRACVSVCLCLPVSTSASVCVCLPVSTSVSTSVCVCLPISVCLCQCMHDCISVCVDHVTSDPIMSNYNRVLMTTIISPLVQIAVPMYVTLIIIMIPFIGC